MIYFPFVVLNTHTLMILDKLLICTYFIPVFSYKSVETLGPFKVWKIASTHSLAQAPR